jgi:hypothetical protein
VTVMGRAAARHDSDDHASVSGTLVVMYIQCLAAAAAAGRGPAAVTATGAGTGVAAAGDRCGNHRDAG